MKCSVIPLLLILALPLALGFGYTNLNYLYDNCNLTIDLTGYKNSTTHPDENVGEWTFNLTDVGSYWYIDESQKVFYWNATSNGTGKGEGGSLKINPIDQFDYVNLTFTLALDIGTNTWTTPGVIIGFANSTESPYVNQREQAFMGIILQYVGANTYEMRAYDVGRGGGSLSTGTNIVLTKYRNSNLSIEISRPAVVQNWNGFRYRIIDENGTFIGSNSQTQINSVNTTMRYFTVRALRKDAGAGQQDYAAGHVGDVSIKTNNTREVCYNNNLSLDGSYTSLTFPILNANPSLYSYVLGNLSFWVFKDSGYLEIDIGNNGTWDSNLTSFPVELKLNESIIRSCTSDFSGNCSIGFKGEDGTYFNYSSINISYYVFGNLSYPSYVDELDAAPFSASFGINLRTNSSLQLVTGGKRYNAQGTFNGIDVFNRTIYPTVGGVHSWWWDYNVSLANGSEYSGSTQALNLSFFVQGFSFDSCAHGSANESVRFNHNYESDNASANGELAVWFKLWKDNPSEYVNKSFVGAYLSTHSYCLEPKNASYKVEALSKFNSPDFNTYDQDYRPRDFWLYNLSVNGSVHNVYLFYVNTTSEVITVKVRDYNDHALPGAFVSAYRFYPGVNEWRRVESRRVDNDGNTVMYLFAYNELYRFIVFYGGKAYVVTETSITSSEIILRVDTLGDLFEDFNVFQNVIYDLSYTNSTSTFAFEYNDLAQKVSQGCLRVVREKIVEAQVCESCSNDYYDILSCAINQSVSGVYTARAYVTISGVEYELDSKSVGIGDFSNPLGFEGLIMALVLVAFLAIFGAMIGGVAGSLIGFVIGFVASSIVFIQLPVSVVMTVVVMAGVGFYLAVRR